MSIEFRCTGCNKLLRTGDGTAGKQAKCPECGAIVTIPAAGTAPPAETPSQAPPSWAGGAESPFAPAPPKPAAFDAENPYAAPREYTASAPGYAPPGAFTPTIIDFGDVFSRTWTIFKVQWGMCLVVVILVGAITFVVNMAVGGVCQVIGVAAGDPIIAVMFSLLGNVVTTLFNVWIGIGEALYFLRIARGQKAEIGEIFAGGPHFFSILVASILVALIVLVGLILFIVPGVIFALMFSQYYYLILDRKVGIIESLNISKDITTGSKLTLFGIGMVEIALVFLGILACCVGLLAVVPFITLLPPIIYLAMTGQPTADQMLPAQPLAR
jgi:phage FluMu protein Com